MSRTRLPIGEEAALLEFHDDQDDDDASDVASQPHSWRLEPIGGGGILAAVQADRAAEGHGDGAAAFLTALTADQAGRRASVERAAVAGLGRWLRRRRVAMDLSLEQAAEAAGTTAARLSMIERGILEQGPTIATLARVLMALELTIRFEETEDE